MYNVDVYLANNRKPAILSQLPVKRDWMSSNLGTYNCDPIVLANTVGYGISFPEDISFVWNGDLIKPGYGIMGKEYIWEGRPEGTVTINSNLIFKTDEDTSILTIPIPNNFTEEYSVISTVLATSFFTSPYSFVLKINKNYINKEIVIPAGTNIACVLPISIKQFDNSNINLTNTMWPFKDIHGRKEYVDALHKGRDEGKKLRLYKKGIDELGNKVGDHEVSKIIMNVNSLDKKNDGK